MEMLVPLALLLAIAAGAGWMAYRTLATERIAMDHRVRGDAPGAFVALSRGMTHFTLTGPEHGPVAVLIPGATLPLWVWKPLDERLAGAGFRVLSYDLYGRGYSDRPNARYDEAFHLQQLNELLDRLVPGQAVHLVCLAFGTLIGAHCAAANPRRVRSFTAVGPDGFGVVMSRASRNRLLSLPLLGPLLFAMVGTRVLMQRLVAYSANPRVVQELAALYRPTLNWIGFKHAVHSSVQHMPIHDAMALYQRMSAQPIPVQVIFGSADAVTPFPGHDTVQRAFRHARLTLLDGAGHLPHQERLDEVTRAVVSFLREAEAGHSVATANSAPSAQPALTLETSA